MLLLSIACALGWSIAALFAWKFYRYAKPFHEQTIKLTAANQKCFDALAKLDATEARYREFMKSGAR